MKTQLGSGGRRWFGVRRLLVASTAVVLLVATACSSPVGDDGSGDGGSGGDGGGQQASLSLEFERIASPGLDPFQVTAFLTENGSPAAGRSLEVNTPRGSVSAVTDNGDGSYKFTVTPSATGIYPVTVSYGGVTVRRDALVLTEVLPGAGQPLLVPGMVNTDGYEDRITITPDGEYLFIQYGPLYFSGLLYLSTICAAAPRIPHREHFQRHVVTY